MAVLKYWDDPDHLFNNYMKEVELREETVERKMLGYDSEPRAGGSRKDGRSAGKAATLARNQTALVPLTENEPNLRA